MGGRILALREQKMAARRERILETAREIIAEEGFDALTTRDLARRAQVTVPTIYNLVGPKDAVLFAAVEEQTERFLRSIGSRAGLAPAAAVVSVSLCCVHELLQDPRYYRALLRLLFASDSAEDVRRLVGRSVVREFTVALGALRDAGELVDWVDSRTLAERLAVLLTAAATQWAAGDIDDASFETTAALGTSLMLLGLTVGEARAELERETRSRQHAHVEHRTSQVATSR